MENENGSSIEQENGQFQNGKVNEAKEPTKQELRNNALKKEIKKKLKSGELIEVEVADEVVVVIPILAKDKINALADKLDKLIKLPKLLELIDGLLLKAGLSYLNENYSHHASNKLKEAIAMAVDGFIDDDIEKITLAIPKAMTGIINLPQLDDDFEGKFYAINIQALLQFMKYYIAKNKEKKK